MPKIASIFPLSLPFASVNGDPVNSVSRENSQQKMARVPEVREKLRGRT